MLRNLTERGGIVVYAKNVLRSILEIDSSNEYVFMYRHNQNMGEFADFCNVTERVIHAPNKLLWDQVAVPRLAKRERLDLIYNPKLSIPLMTQCKTVLVMHGGAQFVVPHVFKWYDRMYFKSANRLFCKKADAIITMTRTGARDIIERMGAVPSKVHIINEGFNENCRVLDSKETEVIKQKYSLPDQYILFLGGISPLKNFTNLLRAYHNVKALFPHKLVVVGFNRWKYSKDLQMIDQLGLRDRMVFCGFVPDEEVPAFYNLADLFMLPSLYEGFGIPVLEAMACGCPVITTQTGCSPEVAGDAALLVDPYNPEAIADAIGRVLSDERLRKNLIEKGLARAKQFSWRKCAAETLATFESVASRVSRPSGEICCSADGA
jgi:glycosyltransferase involved in cell wall biosynthesis